MRVQGSVEQQYRRKNIGLHSNPRLNPDHSRICSKSIPQPGSVFRIAGSISDSAQATIASVTDFDPFVPNRRASNSTAQCSGENRHMNSSCNNSPLPGFSARGQVSNPTQKQPDRDLSYNTRSAAQ